MKMQESGEMYLESILMLSKEKETVRSIDVVEAMNVSKPAVSRAVSKLKKDGYLTVTDNGSLLLTESGKQIAEKIYNRHTLLRDLLMALGVEEKIATQDACKMEHDISDATFEALKKHSQNRK